MATCNLCSIEKVMGTNVWFVGASQRHPTLNITAWSSVSLAGCAENQGSVMKQGAEVTMNR